MKEDRRLYRILDANLDRVREALRVIEEWCRFGQDNVQAVEILKDLRQQLASWHQPQFRSARNTSGDVGTGLTHPQEHQRLDITAVLLANFSRAQEGLRVLEEYSKLYDPAMARAMKQMRYRVYTLETMVMNDRRQKLSNASLYLVTMPVPNFMEQVAGALKGGVDIVQYRDKDLADSDRLTIAKQLKELCQQYDALLIVNDRVDIALAVGADGVHLGQQDLPLPIARQLVGQDMILGQSTTNPEELHRAIEQGADYVGVGPVFPTPTKPNKPAAGCDYVRYARAHCPIPFFAIGGIDLTNLNDTISAGANRIAVVRALMTSADPTAVAKAMRAQLSHANP
ncbi:MAG: thiamine phosphate synthase [Pseudanabaenaceae cyanobacterium]